MNPEESALHRRFLLLLLGIGVAVFWIPQLVSSFWLDETITAWIADAGFAQMFDRAVEFQAMPPTYYVVAWTARVLGGASEVALRMPSLLAMGLATFLLYRLGRRLVDPETGLLAAIVLVTSSGGTYMAGDARPYALGTLAMIAATLELVRWFDARRARDGVAYVLLAALVVYVHYLLVPALAAHVVYAWRRRRDGPEPWHLAIAAVSFLVLLAPLVPHLLTAVRNRDILTFGSPATLWRVLFAIAPRVLAVGLVVGAVVAWRILRLEPDAPGPRSPDLTLLWVWAAAPPVLLFLAAHLGASIPFAPRYLFASLPPVSILVATGVRRLGPPQARRIVAVSVALVSLLSTLTLEHTSDGGTLERWRDAVAASNAEVSDPATPVFVRAGLIESAQPNWLTDPESREYLLSPVRAYPAEGRLLPLPFGLGSEEERYLEEDVVPIALEADRFVVIERADGPSVLSWLDGRVSPEFELLAKRTFADVVVAVFERA